MHRSHFQNKARAGWGSSGAIDEGVKQLLKKLAKFSSSAGHCCPNAHGPAATNEAENV
jgi:hypothetical protein